MDLKLIRYVGKLATYGLKPDLTVFMDLAVKKGLAKCGNIKDRIEKRPCLYHLRVRNGYLKLQSLEPRRIKIVKVEKNKFVTQERIRNLVLTFLRRR
jgi:thymidylate kinase